jgi:hypothetical protein
MRFRKKPVVIEAMLYDGTEDGWRDVTDWANEVWFRVDGDQPKRALEIHTREGVMRADPGDWVIRGVAGEFYPCKPDIFEQTYEEVE